jgi:hypothetical protein
VSVSIIYSVELRNRTTDAIIPAQANYTFFLAMTLHPEFQKKAQAEIDRVIGTERLPTLDDREHLPYTDALVKEVLRWQTVTPQGNVPSARVHYRSDGRSGLPHALQEDDVYDGYLIPKGTICIPNIW